MDLLRDATRNNDRVAGADLARFGIADADNAETGLDDVPLRDPKGMQLGGHARLNTCPGNGDLGAGVIIQELRDIAALGGPDLFGIRFVRHSVDNTPFNGWENIMAKAPSVGDLLDLRGETVLVTGASGNIGQAISERLCERRRDDSGALQQQSDGGRGPD